LGDWGYWGGVKKEVVDEDMRLNKIEK